MTHTRLTLSLLFIVAVVCPMALAQPPVLFFDANTQDDDDEEWANSGSAGGAVPQTDDHPKLEEGTVDVAGMSFFSKYIRYTNRAPCSPTTNPLTMPPWFSLKTGR
jgi:hypothetical protein